MSKAPDNQATHPWLWPGLVLLGTAVLYALLIKPHIVGFEYDDGLYLMASESLAKGNGYHLPYLIGNPALVKYPPLFPIVMMPFWWIAPNFPDNLVWFKGLNIALFLAFLAGFWCYARRFELLPAGRTGLLLILIAFNFEAAKSATNLFSEPLYLLIFVALLWELNRPETRLMRIIMLSVALFYTRSFGLIAIAAAVLWQWLLPEKDKRRWRRSHLWEYIGLCALSIIPWIWWTQRHSPPILLLEGFEIRPFNSGYLADFLANLHEQNIFSMYFTGWSHQLEALGGSFFSPWPPPILFTAGCALLGFLIWRMWIFSKQRAYGFAGCYVVLYLLVLPFWGYYDQYGRLLLPIFPLLLLWLLTESRLILTRKQAIISLMLLAALVSRQTLTFYGWLENYRGDTLLSEPLPGQKKGTPDPVWADFKDAVSAIRDLNHHSQNGYIFWSYHHAIPYALYSQVKFPDKMMILWRGTRPHDRATVEILNRHKSKVQYQWLKDNNVRFMVANARLQMGRITQDWDEVTLELVQKHPGELQLIYATPNNMVWLYALGHNTP